MTRDPRFHLIVCVIAVIVVQSTMNGAGGERHQNLSIGGMDASSNRAGLQARWDDQGSHAGVFIGGATLDAVARGLRPDGPAALVLTVSERGLEGGLLTYVWTPRVEQTIRGTRMLVGSTGIAEARALLRRAQIRFEGLHVIHPPDARPRAHTEDYTPAPPAGRPSMKSRGAGSTQAGLPALSEDPGTGVVQAGWLDGSRRNGVFVRGRWRQSPNGQMTSDERGNWLVAFELDQQTGRIALLQAIHQVNGVEVVHSVDGEAPTFEPRVAPWAARALEWVERERTRHFGVDASLLVPQ